MAGTQTYVLKGGTKVVWGTNEYTGGAGVITGVTRDDALQYERIENNQGAVVGLVLYDEESSVRVDIMMDPDVTPPAIGETLKVAGSDLPAATVTSVNRTAGSKAIKTMSLTAMGWKNYTPGT